VRTVGEKIIAGESLRAHTPAVTDGAPFVERFKSQTSALSAPAFRDLQADTSKRFCAHVSTPPIQFDEVNLHVLWEGAMSFVSKWSDEIVRRKPESQAELQCAIDVCRFFLYSGFLKLFRQHAAAGVLKVDAGELEKSCEELMSKARSLGKGHFRKWRPGRTTNDASVEDLSRKVDTLTAMMERLCRERVHDADTVRGNCGDQHEEQ